MVERAAPPGLDGLGCGHSLLDAVLGQFDTIATRNRLHLFQRSPEQGMSDLISQDSPDEHSGKGCDAAEGADEEELLPDGDPDMGMNLCGGSQPSAARCAVVPYAHSSPLPALR